MEKEEENPCRHNRVSIVFGRICELNDLKDTLQIARQSEFNGRQLKQHEHQSGTP